MEILVNYDENRSKGDVLSVQVITSNTKRDFESCENIRDTLEKATNLSFFVPLTVSIQRELIV